MSSEKVNSDESSTANHVDSSSSEKTISTVEASPSTKITEFPCDHSNRPYDAIDFMVDILNCENVKNNQPPFYSRSQLNATIQLPKAIAKILHRHFTGIWIETVHRPDNKRSKVTGVSETPFSALTFEDKDGETVSVLEYFHKTYPNFKVLYPRLPALDIGFKKKPVLLPMEVCLVDSDLRQKLTTSTAPKESRATLAENEDRDE